MAMLCCTHCLKENVNLIKDSTSPGLLTYFLKDGCVEFFVAAGRILNDVLRFREQWEDVFGVGAIAAIAPMLVVVRQITLRMKKPNCELLLVKL